MTNRPKFSQQDLSSYFYSPKHKRNELNKSTEILKKSDIELNLSNNTKTAYESFKAKAAVKKQYRIVQPEDQQEVKPQTKKVKSINSGQIHSSKSKDRSKIPLDPKPDKTQSKKKQKKSKKAEPQIEMNSGLSKEERNDMDKLQYDQEINEANENISKLPSWLEEENVRDKQGRCRSDENYDPTTLYVPAEELKRASPIFKKYWEFKSIHFDKLVAIKDWKFYHFYHNDALVLSRVLDLQLCKWSKWLLVSYHDSCMAKYASKLLSHGYKIVVVEQMTKEKEKDEGLVKREICQILTRGTAIEEAELIHSSRFLLALFQRSIDFGLVLCDTTTREFYIGEFKDDASNSSLRTILTRTNPWEVVYMSSYIESNTLNILKSLPSKPMLSKVSLEKPQHLRDIFDALGKYFITKDSLGPELPDLLFKMKTSIENDLDRVIYEEVQDTKLFEYERKMPYFYAAQALKICIEYLEDVLLADIVIPMASFTSIDIALEKKGALYLDSQALENLEVIGVQYLSSTGQSQSLLGYMDKTVTAFGKRMFKRWVTAPLVNTYEIRERQVAVEDLLENLDVVEQFRDGIKKLPDIERKVNSVYSLASRTKMSSLYLESFMKNKIKDFLEFLRDLKSIEEIIESFKGAKAIFKSNRLIRLTSFKDVEVSRQKRDLSQRNKKTEALFPQISSLIYELEGMVRVEDDGIVPASGLNKENDEIMGKIQGIKDFLQSHLEKYRRTFKSKDIKYVHTKYRYELEFPEYLVEGSKRPRDFVITSKRKGFLRFHDPDIEKQLKMLTEYEESFKKVFLPFLKVYFQKFYEKHTYWQQAISCLAELDCLCGLAYLAHSMEVKCRPEVLPMNQEVLFELKGMVHPVISTTSKREFVPNDVVVVENSPEIFLITGPNMGGKSTLLRQTCLAAIMAQVGSFVPAEKFNLTAIDRIFTRVGASDRILEGKSTFSVEMEETYCIATEATRNSLLILDELGRGTSTYDGVAIAYATLKYIAENIKCISLFATHYHVLLEEFRLYKNIQTYFMDCEFNEIEDEIRFLYKFVQGKASKSYGIAIAKMAGLPEIVLRTARHKANLMSRQGEGNAEFEGSISEKFRRMTNEILLPIEKGNDFDPHKLFKELKMIC